MATIKISLHSPASTCSVGCLPSGSLRAEHWPLAASLLHAQPPLGPGTQGRDKGEETEARALGTEFKRTPENSVLEIRNILMQYFKKSNLMAKNSIMNKISTFQIKMRSMQKPPNWVQLGSAHISLSFVNPWTISAGQ